MNSVYGFGRFLVICSILVVAGCSMLSYHDRDVSISSFRLGTKDVRDLSVNKVGNSINMSIGSIENDTQTFGTTVQVIANKVDR